MKCLTRIVCGLTLAGMVASCVVSAGPAQTPRVQTTPRELTVKLTDLLRMAEEAGKSIVLVNGGSVACACVPPVQPNDPGPPPPEWNPADAKRAIAALQALVRAREANRPFTVRAATAAEQ